MSGLNSFRPLTDLSRLSLTPLSHALSPADCHSSSTVLHKLRDLSHVLPVHLCCADQVSVSPALPHRGVEGGVGEGPWPLLAPHRPLPASGGGDDPDSEEETGKRLQMVFSLLFWLHV